MKEGGCDQISLGIEYGSSIIEKLGKKTKAALRVNPDVDPKTHKFITTGKKETKFGVDIERAEKVLEKFKIPLEIPGFLFILAICS